MKYSQYSNTVTATVLGVTNGNTAVTMDTPPMLQYSNTVTATVLGVTNGNTAVTMDTHTSNALSTLSLFTCPARQQ